MPEQNLQKIFYSTTGINNRDNPNSSAFQQSGDKLPAVVDANNVDLYRDNTWKSRDGVTKLRNLTFAHSGDVVNNTFYYADNGSIYRFTTDTGPDVEIVSNISVNSLITFDSIAGEVYWSNSIESGRIYNDIPLFWGLRTANPPVLSSTISGSLRAGKYLVSYTFVANGIEGGSREPAAITLSAPGGITGQVFSIDPNATSINVYVSDVNGQDLFYYGNFPVGDFTIGHEPNNIYLFTGFNIYPPPPGHIVRAWNGYLLVATSGSQYGNALYFSEPNGYHRFRLETDVMLFPSRIVLVEPFLDGFYLALESGQTYWYSGNDPTELKKVTVDNKRVSEGKALRVPARKLPSLELDLDLPLPVWITSDGWAIGTPTGKVVHPTEYRLKVNSSLRFTSAFKDKQELRNIISTLRGIPDNRVAMKDQATLTVTRNGETI